MRCIAIDDEPLALEIIRLYCQRIDGVTLSTFTNPKRGMDEVKRTEPDILFLDIEMGETNGIKLAKEIPHNTHLIFTTAYAQFALEGFDLNAIDFLHKPIPFPRFKTAIERVEKQLELKKSSQTAGVSTKEITIKVDYKSVMIRLSEITHIEAMENYIRLYKVDTPRPIITQVSLKSIEEQLPEDKFVRTHKSYIVHIQHIQNYTKKSITINNTQIPIGRTYVKSALEKISLNRE